jgi:hypothetical protein
MKPGLTLHEGHPAGCDPREMTRDELRAASHEPMSPLEALRAHCIDCCAGQAKEVALCPMVDCPAWPFRMGTDPWRKPASPARREAARRTMAKLNARRNRRGIVPSSTAPDHGAEPSPAADLTPAPTWATGREALAQETVIYRSSGAGRGRGVETPGEAADLSMVVA